MSLSKNCARYNEKCIFVFAQSVRYSCQILMKLELSLQIFERRYNIKTNADSFSGSRVVPCGQADGHYEANSRFSHF
jgi:hypothetical protein